MKAESNPCARLGVLAALLAAFALMAIPAAASAQDPAGDQYAPTTPNGGGDYDFEPGTPDPASGTDSGGTGDTGSSAPDETTAPTTPEGTGTTGPTGTTGEGTAGGNGHQGNRDQRTVTQIGAEGEQSRDEGPALNEGADTRLASNEADTSTGLGTALWVLIGAALLWAIALAVINFRRRGDDSGSGSRSDSARRRRDEDGHQPA